MWQQRFQSAQAFVQQVLKEWNEDRVPQLAASMAYYTLFSIVPLLVIAIVIVGLILGRDVARHEIIAQIQGLVGQDGATFIDNLLQNAGNPELSSITAIFSAVTLVLGAAGLFNQMKAILRVIWDTPPDPPASGVGAVWKAIREQFLSVTMVVGMSFLILVSLILSAVLSALVEFAGNYVAFIASWAQLVNFALTFVVTTLIFAAVFKLVPRVDVAWRDVLFGAAITAALFTIGRLLIGLYLGQSAVISTYGAAGSLVVVLLWVYYSAQILFLGAEFTQVYARTYGSQRQPDAAAALDADAAQADDTEEPDQPSVKPLALLALLPRVVIRRSVMAVGALLQRKPVADLIARFVKRQRETEQPSQTSAEETS